MNPLQFIPIIGTILDRVIPDKGEREKLKHEIATMEKNGEIQLLLGQLAINKEEAQHRLLFVAGWRPAVGWSCVAGLVFNFIISPLVALFLVLIGSEKEVPEMDIVPLMALISTMLGMGAIRMTEKIKGVSRNE